MISRKKKWKTYVGLAFVSQCHEKLRIQIDKNTSTLVRWIMSNIILEMKLGHATLYAL